MGGRRGFRTLNPWGHVSKADRMNRQRIAREIQAWARLSKIKDGDEIMDELRDLQKKFTAAGKVEKIPKKDKERYNVLCDFLNDGGLTDNDIEWMAMTEKTEKPEEKKDGLLQEGPKTESGDTQMAFKAEDLHLVQKTVVPLESRRTCQECGEEKDDLTIQTNLEGGFIVVCEDCKENGELWKKWLKNPTA